jgi:hypothetical protein
MTVKKNPANLHRAVMTYLAWGWPLLAVAAFLSKWAGESPSLWRSLIDDAAFAWILCAPVAPITLLLDRSRRERAMAWLCGLREGDERERAVTGEAARATLLLALSLQAVFLAMSLITVHLVWNPLAHEKNKHGLVSVGLSFDASQHLDPFGSFAADRSAASTPIPPHFELSSAAVRFDSFMLSPSAFSILLLLILIEIAAFKAFSGRRYEGKES